MVPRPPVWSSRAALQILNERERRERSKNKRNIPEETLGDSSRRTERRLSDDEFYARFRSDYWSPYECTSIFRRTKYALTVGVGKLFARYTLLVYRHPWTFIIFPAAVCLLLGVGFLFRKVVTDHEKQYALPKSTSHDDAKRYADNFGESQVRSEVIYVTAASGTNLLNTDFLNALWNFHTSVLDLEVTASLGTGEKQNHAAFSMSDGQQLQQQGAESYARENASPRRLFSGHLPDSKSTSTTPPSSPAAISHSSDSVAPAAFFSPSTLSSSAGVADVSSSSASSPCALAFVAAFSPSEASASPSSSLQSTSCAAGASGPFIKSSVARYLKNETVRERRSRGRKRGLAAAWPQTLGSGRLFGDRMWRGGGILPPGAAAPPVPGGPFLQNLFPFRPMPPAVGGLPPTGPPSLSPPGRASPPGPPRGEDTPTGPPCVEASAHPKDRISGLACRPPVKSGHYAFSNLCWKDAAGICAPPDGVIFMYNSRGEFGNPLGYPRHANWVLATEAPTDIWLSQRGLQLAAGGSQARATAGLALRYLLSDDPAQRPAAIEWEHALMRHINRAGDALPGASLYVKTEQSLAEDLSSSIDPTGHEDIIYVLIAALLIFIYLGFATFSTNRYRSKMLVSLIGGLAAALAYCGGAGLCYLVGLEHTTTVTAAPFLVLGIGVDDVFVIINSYALTYTRASARERLRITMRDAGVSITVTTLTNLISFAIGSTSPYLAIKNFCVITAAGLFAGYLMCITFFVGCLTIDARYEEKRRLDEVCSCLLPVYRHWHAGNKKTEKSTSASAAAASQANASSSHVGVDPGQQPLPDRIAGGEEDSNDSIKQLDGAAHTKQPAPRVLTEVKGKRRLDYMRQSLLNRHANTVYECVTLQVAMALTKGKVDKNASARNATLQSFWGRVKPSQKQVQGRSRDSRSPHKNSQGIVSQPQTGVYHPLSNDPAAVANHSGSPVVRSHMRKERDHESGKSSETYRTDVTSQEARATSRWNQQRSVAQPRHLTNGFFEGDLVLTHQIPVRTSSNSTPTDDYAERKKRRISNPKDVYSVLRGRLYSRKGQGQITQFVCQENGAAAGWGADGNFCTSRLRRPHDEDLEGQLKHGAGRYRSREGHRSRARHNNKCSHASETYTYAQRREQSDGSDAAPAPEREQHTWKDVDGARQLGRGGRRQNGPSLQGIKLSDTYDYESQGHERSTLQAKQKKVCLRGEGPAEAATDEDHDSYQALKSHSYEQTGFCYCPKNRGGGSGERRRFAQAGHVNSRQHKVVSQLPKKAKKTTYKRRRQNPSVRLAAPTRWGRGSVYDSMAHKRRQSDKRERIAGRQGIQAQHGALMGERLQRYSPRQHQLSQAPTERREVAQSRISRPREDQEHSAAKRDNIAEGGGVLPLSQKGAGRPVSSLKPTRKTTFNGQRKRRFPLSADSDAASLHEAAEGSRNEGAKNTGTGSRPRGRNLEKAEEQANGGLRENSAKQKQATRVKEETNDFDRAKSQRVTDTPGYKGAGNLAPADAGALQREASSDRRLKDTDIDVRKVQNLRKPSLLQRLGRRRSDNTTGEEDGGATQGHQQNRSAFKVHSNSIKSDSGGGLPATPQSPQARRHELLRILKPEDLAEPPGNVGRLWRLLVLHHLGRIFITPVVKLIVLVGFAAIFAVAVTGCMKLKRGLDLRNLSRDGSSLKKFFDVQANYFSTYGDPVNIFFLKPQQPCSLSFKSEYAWFHNLLESRQYTKLLVDGLDTYLKSPLGGLSPSDNAAACMQMLRSWLQTPMGSNFAWQFTWQNDGELKAFQIQLVPRYYSGSKELSDFMTMLREDLTRFKSASVHAYNKHFIFYESDSNVLASTLSNMAWAVLAVTVVSLILLPSLWSAAMVIFILILIDVAIMGFMYYWDLPLNMLTMVNLIISIGFSIDYASHMCHTFSHCVGRSRDMRVFETLVLIGNPIFHGVMSTQLGVLVLAYTCSYVLRVFFKMMTLVLTLAFAHGAVLLPVLLSLFGPMGSREEPLNVALSNFREGLTLNRILSKKYSA